MKKEVVQWIEDALRLAARAKEQGLAVVIRYCPETDDSYDDVAVTNLTDAAAIAALGTVVRDGILPTDLEE